MSGGLMCTAPPVFELEPEPQSSIMTTDDAGSAAPFTPSTPAFTSADPAFLSSSSSMMSTDPMMDQSVFSTTWANAPTEASRSRRKRAQRREWRAAESRPSTPSPSEDRRPTKGTDRTDSPAGGGGPSEGAARREGAGAAIGGGGSPARGGAVGDMAPEDQATLMKLALPPPRPASGTVSVRREPLFLGTAPKGFAAPTTLDVRAARPSKQSAAEQKAVNPLATDPGLARSTFNDAAIASRNLYDKIVRAAAEIAADAHAANQMLSDMQQLSLDRQMHQLDEVLSTRITDAHVQRDFALNHIRSRADLLRLKVRGQAARAMARLAALSGEFTGKLSPLRGNCAAALGTLQTASSDAFGAANDAHFELQALGADANAYLSTEAPFNGDSAVAAAELEAALHYIGPRITADDTALAQRLEAVDNFLKPMLACFPCEIDTKFQTLESHASNLAVAGPRAVRNARDGALKSINDTQRQLELAVHDAHRQTEIAATEQHGTTRLALVAQARSAGASDRQDIALTAKRQSDMLLGLAAAQPISLTKVHDELQRSGDLPPAQFAPMVIRASRRFKANVEGSAERNPGQVLQTASAQARARRKRVGNADRDRDDLVAQYGRGLAVMVDRNFQSLAINNETVLLGLDQVPAQVGSTCDGFVTAAQQALDSGYATLATDSAFLVTRMTDALDGLIPIAPPPAGSGTVDIATSMLSTNNMMSVAPPLMSIAPPPASVAPAAPPPPVTSPARRGGGAPATVPPPASCAPCAAAQAPTAGTSTSTATSSSADGGSGTSGIGPTAPAGPGPDVGVSSAGTHHRSPRAFREFADGIAMNVVSAPQVAAFLQLVPNRVLNFGQTGLNQRANAAHAAVSDWGVIDFSALMAPLQGLTRKQGAALNEVYANQHDGARLSDSITNLALMGRLGRTPSTNEFRRDSALAAIGGDITGSNGAAINALRAGFNFTNSTDQIMTTMRSMSSGEMAEFVANNRSELESLITQLDESEQAEFRQLMTGDMTRLRALQIRTDIDTITRDYWNGGATDALRNERRGDRTGEVLGDAREGSGAYAANALEGPADRVDVFGLEDPSVSQARTEAHWAAVQADFGNLPGVIDAIIETNPDAAMSRPGDSAGSILINYATRPIQMYPWRDGQYGTRSPYAQPQSSGTHPSPYPPRVSEVDSYHRLWIENVVDKGRNSREARAARGLIAIRRAGGEPKQDDLEAALHIGTSDAREGGHFEHGSPADAERERGETFVLIERYRRRIEGGGREDDEITVADAQASFRREVEFSLRNAPDRQAMALGLVDHEEGNVQAVIDYAIAHENKELLTRYLGRMDSRQIETMIGTWNANHPEGPGLEARLGINGNHWSTTNWNGAVFTGDEANAPRNRLHGCAAE